MNYVNRPKLIISFVLIIVFSLITSFGLYADADVIFNHNGVSVHITDAQVNLSKLINQTGIGNNFQFGHFEQDDDEDNGKEPVDWILLKKDESNKTALLCSLYLIDCMRVNGFNINCNWETCTLRQYMNTDMLSEMFTEDERNCIVHSYVTTSPNIFYNTDCGNPTYDYLYIPSIEDIYCYFSENIEDPAIRLAELLRPNYMRMAKGTKYAISKGLRVIEKKNMYHDFANYFLRTSGQHGHRKWYRDVYATYYQAYISEFGSLVPDGTGVDSNDDGIRVMMQVYY